MRLILNLTVIAIASAVIAGCTVRAELDYGGRGGRSEDETTVLGAENGTQSTRRSEEKSSTTLHIGIEGRLLQGESKAVQQAEVTDPVPIILVQALPPDTPPKPIQNSQPIVNLGTVKIHVGDVNIHQHTTIHMKSTVGAPEAAVRQSWMPPDQLTVQASRMRIRDERCERLRREHERRVAEWSSLFDP